MGIDKERLLKYLRGKGTEEDREIILKWFENPVSENEICKESQEYWNSLNSDAVIPDYNSDYLLNRIYRMIKQEEGSFMTEVKPRTRFITYLTRIAAAITVPLLIASLLLYFQNRSYKNIVSWAEIHAPYGTRTDFSLPDGSKGRLNGGSTLRFPVLFNGKTRQVELTGEAYFNIVSNEVKPFIVSTKDIDVKVRGTSFNVMAYPDESGTEVALKSGIVEVFRKKDSSIENIGRLKPNELFAYNSSTGVGEIKQANIANKLSWLDGKLTFKYERFNEVIQKLNRWYNVNIIIKDKRLDSFIYYGTFQNETLDEVLRLLEFTAPIKYKDFPREQNQDGTYEKRKIELYSRN